MPPTQTEAPERVYPALEEFVESAAKGDPKKLFASTRASLSEVAKGPKGPAAQKALSAIDCVEGLLDELLSLRESLVAQAGSAKKTRR